MTEATPVQFVQKGSTGVCLPTREFIHAEAYATTPAHVAVLQAQAKAQCEALSAHVEKL